VRNVGGADATIVSRASPICSAETGSRASRRSCPAGSSSASHSGARSSRRRPSA
jgi:hypothetical protein